MLSEIGKEKIKRKTILKFVTETKIKSFVTQGCVCIERPISVFFPNHIESVKVSGTRYKVDNWSPNGHLINPFVGKMEYNIITGFNNHTATHPFPKQKSRAHHRCLVTQIKVV